MKKCTKSYATRSIALGILIAAAGCGGGGGGEESVVSASPASNQAPAPAPAPEASPIPSPAPQPAPSPSPGPSPAPEPSPVPAPQPSPSPAPAPTPPPMTGADINMRQPFNQQVDCKYGAKPYYEPEDSGPWTVSFDGSSLKLQSLNGTRNYGGSFDTGYAEVERENYTGAALLQTVALVPGLNQLGTIYFTKSLMGEILSTGTNRFFGSRPVQITVECGGNTDAEWLARPDSTPFASEYTDERPSFSDGTVAMNCAKSVGPDRSNLEITGAQAIISASGEILMRGEDGNTLFSVDNFNGPDRTVAALADTPLTDVGGIRLYRSSDTDNNAIFLNLRWDNLVRSIAAGPRLSPIEENDVYISCVPAPLKPF